MKALLYTVVMVFPVVGAFGQASFVPLDDEYYHRIDRYEVKAGQVLPWLFTGVKPYRRDHVATWADSVTGMGLLDSRADEFNMEYLRNDSWEWSQSATSDSERPALKYFYRKKSDLYHVDEPDFDLHINPVIYLGAGNDARRDGTLYINTRGVEVRGRVDNKIGFYTYLTDNQALVPSYVQDRISRELVVPHEGFWKSFKADGIDFLQARGYFTFAISKHIDMAFGHDNAFIGNGYRSLIRSDDSPPSLFLRANVKIWKVNYLFLLNRMTADVFGNPSGLTANDKYPEKFSAMHHASINIGKHLNIGVFEAVVFSPKDSLSANRFEWSYLNPIIFYRAVEQQFGSSDNVILGGDFKWNMARGLSIYGQIVIDEFVLSNLRAGNGWWANKFGIQGGMKYIDAFGVSNLDLQAELNAVRPYTYSHSSVYGSYSSYRQPLAHPLGANFYEGLGIVRYQPLPRLILTGKLFILRKGRDGAGENWGGDILKINASHPRNYGNTIGQGRRNDIVFGTLAATWQLRHNLFVDASLTCRDSESPDAFYNYSTTLSFVALRWNIARRVYEF